MDWIAVLADIGKAAGAITALVGLAHLANKYLIAPARQRVAWRRSAEEGARVTIQSMAREVQDVNLRVAVIQKQVLPDGGSSLRDEVGEVLRRVTLTEQMHAVHLIHAGVGQFRTDTHGLVVDVNRALARISGRVPGEFMGNGWENAIAAPDRRRVRDDWEDAVDARREFESNHALVRPDGSPVVVHVTAYPYLDAAGAFAGHLGFVHVTQLQ